MFIFDTIIDRRDDLPQNLSEHPIVMANKIRGSFYITLILNFWLNDSFNKYYIN